MGCTYVRFPAVTITAGFKGTAVGIVLTDSGSRNYYNVFVDDGEVTVGLIV
ncbi:MAG: hypothetical protein JXJ04_13420 [Spirochaetales bacterium]|nr:hypothetical protein [Spirochaetales bacterium]